MEEEFDGGVDSTSEDTEDTDVRGFLSGLFAGTELTEYSEEDRDLIKEFLGIKENDDGSNSV